MFVWQASITGPDESPWEGGIYTLRMNFGESYPDKPPRCTFLCEMYHPNGGAWHYAAEFKLLDSNSDNLCCTCSLRRWDPLFRFAIERSCAIYRCYQGT